MRWLYFHIKLSINWADQWIRFSFDRNIFCQTAKINICRGVKVVKPHLQLCASFTFVDLNTQPQQKLYIVILSFSWWTWTWSWIFYCDTKASYHIYIHFLSHNLLFAANTHIWLVCIDLNVNIILSSSWLRGSISWWDKCINWNIIWKCICTFNCNVHLLLKESLNDGWR